MIETKQEFNQMVLNQMVEIFVAADGEGMV